MNLRLRVPATTSNVGPGFDCFGMAVDLHLEVEVRAAPALTLTAEGADVPLDRSNLVVATMVDALGGEVPKLALHFINRIPLARGLGSSATARVAGLALAELVKKGAAGLDRDWVGREASRLEHHPDNAMAAVHGAFCIGSDQGVERLDMTDRPYLVAIPSIEIHTEAARAALPRQISLADAVFNLQQTARVVARLAKTGDLAAAAPFADVLHQRHRLGLSAPLKAAFEASAALPGLAGIFLSGSGPTVFLLPELASLSRVKAGAEAAFAAAGLGVEVREVRVDRQGLQVLPL